MKEIAAIGVRLTIICAAAALVLGVVNHFTAPRIAFLQEEKVKNALKQIAPEGEIGEARPLDDPVVLSYYPVVLNGETVSYIVELKGQGYGGDLQILAGYRRDGELTAAVLMANGETPGLGKNAEKAGYMDKFIGTGGERPVPVKKTQLLPQEAEGVSGSTVTFGGIARALSAGAEEVKLLEDLR